MEREKRINPDEIPPWNPLHVHYYPGALLTYAGSVYRARYDHLSMPGRDPYTARDLYEEEALAYIDIHGIY